MTTKEKIELINHHVDYLNTTFLSCMYSRLSFDTKGKGKYSLAMVYKKRELKDTLVEFHTYDEVIHALELYINIYHRAIHERKTFRKGGDK